MAKEVDVFVVVFLLDVDVRVVVIGHVAKHTLVNEVLIVVVVLDGYHFQLQRNFRC